MAASMEPGNFVQLFTIFAVFTLVYAIEDEYHEELMIKPFSSGHVYSHFQFTTSWNVSFNDENSYQHYRLFPKALGEVLAKYSVQELHLSLTQGLWRHEKWGYPVIDSPPGAELWVWFQDKTTNVDQTWSELVNALSGLFCASLNFMDSQSSVSPQYSFRPHGVASEFYLRNLSLLRYAALPRELVCTENLTPWKKLLPCNSKAGLSSLFKSGKLYDTTYHSLTVNVRPVCKDESCLSTATELSQTLSAVFDPLVINKNSKQDWSLKSLFGKSLSNTCPLAMTSKIFVDVTSNKTASFKLTPDPSVVVTARRGSSKNTYAVYDSTSLNVAASYTRDIIYRRINPPHLYAHRYVTGFGQEKGGIESQLYNTHPTKTITVIYMETIPWFIRTYLHTLKIENNGTALKPSKFHYIPGKDRVRQYHLEIVIDLPANSMTRISLQFERAFLKWTEYPPDANHGFYINSAVISAVISDGYHYTSTPQRSSRISASFEDDSTEFFVRLHTETLLVSLPTPDFSMPYNVICLACTVVAIAFGSIHNVTTRRFVAADPTKKTGLKAKITQFINKLRGKKTAESEDSVVSSKDSEPSEEDSKKTR